MVRWWPVLQVPRGLKPERTALVLGSCTDCHFSNQQAEGRGLQSYTGLGHTGTTGRLVIIHTYNPSTQEAEAGGLPQIPDKPGTQGKDSGPV